MHYNKAVFRSLAMISQVGFCVLAPVLFCVYVGYRIDSRTGASRPKQASRIFQAEDKP